MGRMFLIRAFPNITDDFLVAYRFAEILSKRWRVGACFTNSDLTFPAIHEDDMRIFGSDLPLDSISLWFGPSQNYSIGNYKNYAFLTTVREGVKPAIIYQMDKYWELGNDFPYPFSPDDTLERSGILYYAPPMYNRMIEDTIMAWAISDVDEPIKILSPMSGIATLENIVASVKKKTGCKKVAYISSPNSTCPDDIKRQILQSRAIVDFRKSKSISYANTIAQSNGIPTLGTSCVYPIPDMEICHDSKDICKDGSRLSGEIIYKYDIELLAYGFNNIMSEIGQRRDTTKDILLLSKEMIVGD